MHIVYIHVHARTYNMHNNNDIIHIIAKYVRD